MSHAAAALLLPGMALNATIFPDLPVAVTRSPDFSRFAPRGTGMQPYIDHVDALVRDSSWTEAQDRLVVAHSFGGMLALAWLLAGSDAARRVTGLVLIGTTAGPMFDAARLRLARLGHWEWRVGVSALLPLWNSVTITRLMQWLMNRGPRAGHPVDFRALPYRDDIRVGMAGWRATAWEARRGFRAAMRGFDVRDRLREIALPTIVLHGTRDCYFTAETAAALAAGLRGELRLVEGAGHVLPLTHGDTVRRAVADLTGVADQSAPASSSA